MRYGRPCQRSMFGLRQERSTLPTSASNQRTRAGELGVHGNALHVQVQRARQEIHPEVAARARAQQVLHLLVGLTDRERRIDVAP